MPASRYASGTKAWGLCKRCGLQFYLRDLVFDGYMPGLRVCEDCYDGRHPQEYPIDVTDPEALWKPTPDDPPYAAVVTGTVTSNVVNLSWTQPDSSGAGRYETYTLMRASSTDGVNFTAFVTLGVFPVTYWADALDLADLVEGGNPTEDNGGIESQTLSYQDQVTFTGYFEYVVTAQNTRGNGPASLPFVVQVTQLVPFRVLEDAQTFRVLEDGVSLRELEY